MITAHVMQKEGLEPSWYHYHTDLNRARLPIPPQPHFSIVPADLLGSLRSSLANRRILLYPNQ